MSYDLQVLNGDLVISSGTADLAIIQGNAKLIQDLLKIAITTAGSNPLQPWYGSLVSKTLIGSFLSSDIVIATAQSQLQNAIENLQNLQNLQVQSGQTVTPDEQISFINDISITRSTVDPRLFSVIITVLSKSYGKVAAAFTANNT
jgi:hypothetical protein